MIYLIESAAFRTNEKGEDEYFPLLKIGYTKDEQRDIRFSTYKMHNPTYQVLYEIPKTTEKRIQYKFKDLLFENYKERVSVVFSPSKPNL